MKRIAVLLLALVLCLVTLTDVGPALAEEKLTISVMQSVRDIDTIDVENNWAIKYLEEKTGVHVAYDMVKQSDWNTKLTLTLASGALPDVIWGPGALDAEEYGILQQLVIPLDGYLEECMPTLKSRFDMEPAATVALTASDGHIYGLPSYYFGSPATPNDGIPFIQKAWLDALNLEMPKTVDELTDVLRAFKTGDPNGNGIADEIPLSSTITDGANCSIFVLFSFWGIPTDGRTFFSLDEEGKVTFDPYRPGFRDALEWLNLLYAEGLMDVETLTQDVSTTTSKIADGVVGLFPFWRLTQMNIDANLETAAHLYGVAAEGYTPKMHTNLGYMTPRIYLTKDNQHVEETLRWFDAQLEKETMFNMYCGPKDGNWHYEEDGSLSYFSASGDWSQLCLNVQAMLNVPTPMYAAENINLSAAYVEKAVYVDAHREAGMLQTYPNTLLKIVPLSADDTYEINLILADIQTAVQEFVSKSITEGVTDESWNAFMDICGKLRVDEYISIYQNALDASGMI